MNDSLTRLLQSELFTLIEEQMAFEFVGHLNLLARKDNRFLGKITFKEGKICHVSYKDYLSLKGLFYAVVEGLKHDLFKVVVEPEVVDSVHTNIFLEFNELIDKIKNIYLAYEKSKHLKPNDNVKLVLNPKFISSGPELTPEEFDTMQGVMQYPDVKNIYQYSEQLEHEITLGLVGLRKKGCIRVK